ncbi:hypothetical protein B0T26DRAFT_638253 [Lasiosphaeria miniovina]|uniref:Dihydroorotate dehydrogenase (fumarate) n=1 Tax=Lasiosphaeria miniovina TaxID=1954250 RepID=A0AA40B3W8_9PEZI|nr:uncharacterized protein B0T26DRAFT_638253 [Lasiosphaeria miniovina]KAK0727052.1 hypothetical protein B0T26DRAFT_638253 [Lasiosphaeria miniovina]
MVNNKPPVLDIDPPLVNSANPWATTLDDLRSLYSCTSTGAVTTRTSLIGGFDHDPSKHQYVLFDAATHAAAKNASLNCLGYSPHTLETYLSFIKTISDEQQQEGQQRTARPTKGFIVSVTGTPAEVAASYWLVAAAQRHVALPLAVEVNLSCPNIPDKPPPAYSRDALAEYLAALSTATAATSTNNGPAADLPRIPFGLKTPPYTHAAQFSALMDALAATGTDAGRVSPVSFLTATNTLGSCLVLSATGLNPVLPAPGVGGLGGAPLHPLALGNVATLRRMLDADPALVHVQVVGVGGVLDADGYRRMRSVGAAVVGVGTGLGLRGVSVFGEIEARLGGLW